MKKSKLLFLSLFQIFIAGTFIAVVQKSIKLVDFALSRDGFDLFNEVAGSTKEVNIIRNDEKKEQEKISKFIQNNVKKEYYIKSYDQTCLFGQAYYQKQPSDKWAIVVHGYSGNGESMLYIARRFHKMGYNVLLPDCRGHGRSQGEYVTMGWHDRLDMLRWVKEITTINENAKILLYGQSMGGAAVMMTSGEELPDNVKCIIEDCGYTSVSEEFTYHLKKQFKLPKFPFIHLAEIVCRVIAGYTLSEASALKQVRKCRIPLLFIHGEKDDFVPTQMAYKLYEAAKCEKEIFIVPEAGHGVSANVGKEKYWDKISDFTSKYLAS